MRIMNIIDEQGRYSGFKADTSYRPQSDSHMVSYLYAREHYFRNGREKIGLEVDNLKEIQNNLSLDRILSHYGLTRVILDEDK